MLHVLLAIAPSTLSSLLAMVDGIANAEQVMIHVYHV
jgi:hypothetical protein